jgi:agmatine/peptidylarginine deiminase
LNSKLKESRIFNNKVSFKDLPIVFEGGSIDSNGNNTALTTANCIFSKNRNEHIPKEELINLLKDTFGLKTLHILEHGYLEGDDTDSHIDMLARFVTENTIVHASCNDIADEHYEALNKMRLELKALLNGDGEKYNLIELPIGKVFCQGKRLPASYINFLLINDAVLAPQYNVQEDKIAIQTFKEIYPERSIIPIDCSLLIKQGGSLHCATMNFFEGTIN